MYNEQKGEKKRPKLAKIMFVVGAIVFVLTAVAVTVLFAISNTKTDYQWVEDYRTTWGYSYTEFHKDATLPWEAQSYYGVMTNETCRATYYSNHTISVTPL